MRKGRPWSLSLEDRVLLVAAYWRANLTLRQLAPLFGVSKSAADRIIDHLGPSLVLQQRQRFRKDTVLIVDGTPVPTRDHQVAEQPKNYRYSTNHQVVIDADTRLVVAVGRPLPGNRNDCKAWELSGAKDAVGDTTVIATPGLEGGTRHLPPQGPRLRRTRLRPHEDLEDPPRLPPERQRSSPRHAWNGPPAQPRPCRVTRTPAGHSTCERSFTGQLSEGECCGNGLVEAGHTGRFVQQYRTGLWSHGPAVIPDKDMGMGPGGLLHLESASDSCGNKDLSNLHCHWAEAFSAGLTTCRTARFMKARG